MNDSLPNTPDNIEEEFPDQWLRLSFMSLPKPTFHSSLPVYTDENDLLFPNLSPFSANFKPDKDNVLEAALASSCGISAALRFPSSDDLPVYLGTVWKCFLAVTNTESDPRCVAKNLVVTVNLISVLTNKKLVEYKIENLNPGKTRGFVIQHQIASTNKVVLSATVSYQKSIESSHTIKKTFNVTPINPLQVMTKIRMVRSQILIEARVRNMCLFPLYLQSIKINTPPTLTSADLSNLSLTEKQKTFTCEDDENFGIPESPEDVSSTNSTTKPPLQQKTTTSNSNPLEPKDIRHFLFLVAANPENSKRIDSDDLPMMVGQLDITWRTFFGDRGRLQTPPLKRSLVTKTIPIAISCRDIPQTVQLNKQFTITVSLKNLLLDQVINTNSNGKTKVRPIRLRFDFNHKYTGGIVLVGKSGTPLPSIPPGQAIEKSFSVIPVIPGLHPIEGLVFHDLDNGDRYHSGALGHILVT